MMNALARLRLFVHPASIRLFLQAHALFRTDGRYSPVNLLKAVWFAMGEDKIVRHDGRWITSSFLPPLPSRAAYQVLKALPATQGYFEAQMTGRRLAPISMYVAVTDQCPYRCEHCSAGGRSREGNLSGPELKSVLAALQEMGTAVIGLTGGEPLLRDDLCELISTLDDRSVCILFTSGYGLTRDKALALKQAGLFAVGISLDSDEAAEMDARRGCAGAFDRAVQAVRICREAGLYTMTQTVAERDSVRSGKLHRIVSLSGTIGAHEVRVLETMPSGRLARIAADRILSAEDREELKRFHTAMNRKRNLPKVSVFAHTEDSRRYGCGAGTQHSYLDASGNLYPCDFVPLSFGNIRDQPIAKLWRDMHNRIGMPRQGCMILELYAKQLLSDKVTFPVAPSQSEVFVRQLDVMDHMPGFYRRLAGNRETHRA